MSLKWRGEKGWAGGCVRRIMRLMQSWERRGLIVGGGRNGGGGMGGRAVDFGLCACGMGEEGRYHMYMVRDMKAFG